MDDLAQWQHRKKGVGAVWKRCLNRVRGGVILSGVWQRMRLRIPHLYRNIVSAPELAFGTVTLAVTD